MPRVVLSWVQPAGEAERKAALAQAHDVSVRVGVDLEILGEPPPLSLEQVLQPRQIQRFAREGEQPLVQAIYDAVGRAAMHALRKENSDG